MAFVFCAALRLARFNAALEDRGRPEWAARYFRGVPAPAAALLVLLPFNVSNLMGPGFVYPGSAVALHLIAVALLMVSRVPTFSSKHLHAAYAGSRMKPLLLVTLAAAAAGLVAAPWLTLSLAGAAYLASIAASWLAYRREMASERAANPPAKPLKR